MSQPVIASNLPADGEDLPVYVIVIVACICGSLVFVLTVILIVLCVRRQQARRQYENDLAANCGQKCDQNKQLLASSTAAVSKATVPASGGSGSPYKVVPSHSNDDNAANDRTERHLPITNRQQATESHMQQQQQSLVSSASAASPSAQQQQQMRVAIPRSRSSQQHLNDARPLSQQFPSNGHLHHQQQQQQQQYVYGGGGNGRPSSVYGAYGVPVQMRTQQQQHQQQRPPSVHGLLPASVTVPGSLQQQQRLTSASSQPTYDTHVSWRLSLSQSALQQGQGQGSSSGHVMPMHSQNSISANHDSASNDGQQQQQQQQRARKIIYEVVV